MRKHTDAELKQIASMISSEITNSQNTTYCDDGRTVGWMMDTPKAEKIIMEYAQRFNLSDEDLTEMLKFLKEKAHTKLVLKSTGYGVWGALKSFFVVFAIVCAIAFIVSLF